MREDQSVAELYVTAESHSHSVLYVAWSEAVKSGHLYVLAIEINNPQKYMEQRHLCAF
jgi:hypothetical protein